MSVTRSMDDQLSVLSLTTGQPASLSSLPPELILRILELAVEDDTTINFTKHRRTLTRASLVAKKWIPLAKLLLLSKIYLDDRRASGPVLEGLLAAFGDKCTTVCQRIVLQGPKSNQECSKLFTKPRAIHELVLLGCTFPQGIANFLRAKALEGLHRLSLSNCSSSVTDQGAVGFTQPSGLVQLKLGYAWRYTFTPNNNLKHLLTLCAKTLRQLTVQLDTPDDVQLLLDALAPADLSLATLSLVFKTGDLTDLAQLVNACPTTDTLILECAHSLAIEEILSNVDPALKLKRLVLNLRASLVKSTEEVLRWLALPSLSGLEVLVLRGTRVKVFAGSDEGQGVLEAARRRGVKEVFLHKG